MECKLTLLNHASVNIETEELSFTTDPWFMGSAFGDGWSLRFPTPSISSSILKNSDYVYISHEHPDHFSPLTLRQIESEKRKSITILYQQTKDRKLRSWCINNGFEFIELIPDEWTSLGVGCEVILGCHPFDDTWLALKTGGTTFLNTNDCVLDKGSMERIKHLVGPVDVLLSQFSYAGWVGNKEDSHLRELAASAVMSRLLLQNEILAPKFIVPFASSFYFSAEDNQFMNDSVNTLPDVIEQFETVSTLVIGLIPGKTWPVGHAHSNDEAIEAWAHNDFRTLPRNQFETYSETELIAASRIWVHRIKSKNNTLLLRCLSLLGLVSRLNVCISDLGKTFRFSPLSGLKEIAGTSNCIEMHSSAFLFLVSNEYGIDTLLVNGRFQLNGISINRFIRAFGLGKLNNTGRSLSLSLLCDYRYLIATGKRAILRPKRDKFGKVIVRA